MNINPNTIRILAFGDSNTWGRVPGDDNGLRYSINERWTGILQSQLGEGYEVIEEGLNGRTTDLESPQKEGKNGAAYLYPCLESHKPLDWVIISLGTNDLKAKYNRSPEEITQGLRKCLDIVKKEGKDKQGLIPKIIIVIPPIIEEQERLRFGHKEIDFLGGKEKSKRLPELFKRVANEYSTYVLDLSKDISVSEMDGVHLEKDMHKRIADLLYSLISK